MPITTQLVECIECESEIQTPENLENGEILDCGTCGVELEVIQTSPVEIQEAPELEEDWGE